MRKLVSAASLILLASPLLASAQYYYGYQGMPTNYGYHNFSPVTYVNTSPYVSVNAPQYTSSSYAYSYPGNSYSYPYSYSYPTNSYSYPSYQSYWYDSYSYNYSPGYSYSYDYWYSYPQYQSYSYPSYAYDYGYNSYDYCYSGYGCYPMPVDDPHQWIYDHWTGNWY